MSGPGAPLPPPSVVVGTAMFIDICNDHNLVGPTVAWRQALHCTVREVYQTSAPPTMPPYTVTMGYVSGMVGGHPSGPSMPVVQTQPQGCWVVISTI